MARKPDIVHDFVAVVDREVGRFVPAFIMRNPVQTRYAADAAHGGAVRVS